MEITSLINNRSYHFTLSGTFTFNDHAAFRDVLTHMADSNIDELILHMNQVEFVDSAALGMLLLARDEAEKHHKKLIISGATGQVKKMFDMAKFGSIFTMH